MPQLRGGGAGAGTSQPGGARAHVRTVSVTEAGKGQADAEGFIRVGASAKNQSQQLEGAKGAERGQAGVGTGTDTGGAEQQGWAAAGDDGDQVEVDGDADPGDDGHDAAQITDVDELRRYWEDAKELLSFAKRQGHPEDHPARRAAQRQVDEAFAEWRAATPPKAVHARMGWAEEALRRAQRAQTKAEQELEELDRQYELDRQQCVQALQAARDKTREREQKLAELSREAAEEYQGDTSGEGGRLLRGTFKTLDAQVGPALEELLASMEKGSAQYNVLHQTLQSVTTMHAALGVATGGSAVDFFDMAEGEGGTTDPMGGAQVARAEGGTDESAMDTTEARAPRWLEPKRGGEPDPASTTGAQPPRWKKFRAGGGGGTWPSTEGQPAPNGGGAGGAGNGGAAAAAAAAAAASSSAAAAVPTAAAAAGAAAATARTEVQSDGFDARREQIILQAQSDNIEVPPGYLQQLCPEALEEWAREHLL